MARIDTSRRRRRFLRSSRCRRRLRRRSFPCPIRLVQVSGASPFAGCDRRCRAARDRVPEQRGRAVDRTSTRRIPNNLGGIVAAGPLGRTAVLVASWPVSSSTAALTWRAVVDPGRHEVRGGRPTTAADRPVGQLRSERRRLPAGARRSTTPRRRPNFDHGAARRASRPTVGLTWSDSAVRRDPRPRRERLQRQAVDHGRSDAARISSTPSGIASSSRRASGRAYAPDSAPQRFRGPDVVRAQRRTAARRWEAGASDLRPGAERPDDRQPDRRAARTGRSSTSSTSSTTRTRRSSAAGACG